MQDINALLQHLHGPRFYKKNSYSLYNQSWICSPKNGGTRITPLFICRLNCLPHEAIESLIPYADYLPIVETITKR